MAVADDICASRSEQLSSKARRRATWMRVLAGVLAIGTVSLFSACSGGSPKCPKDDGDPCTLDECKAGVAVNSYLGDGHPCFVGKLQGACKAGRCAMPCEKTSQCNDGLPCTRSECLDGVCVIEADDYQTAPEDGNACTEEHCIGGKVVSWLKPDGSSCPGGECASGVCGSCNVPADCGSTTECLDWSCEQNHCVSKYDTAGTHIPALDFIGDCQRPVCDGHGIVVNEVTPSDKPWSYDACFEWVCIGVTPLRAPKIGTNCIMDGGLIGKCSESGMCVQCVKDLDCPVAHRCEDAVCVKCGDYHQNGDEICGGSCGQCKATSCDEDSDCASGQCVFTNGFPARVCCTGDCAGICEQCDAMTGTCVAVPKNQKDDSCLGIGLACFNSQCKTITGYPCIKGTECISGLCVNGTCG
ncbi:hypothetical protein [Polyangium sp. 15x6]|uniref:hypothetical protein n=1 Tax=Polyangium sp. 15x6 TaxID=3042687 RepID=UPI002499E79A|nr:hypothetical protein [Polyangium sp. 15x6]